MLIFIDLMLPIKRLRSRAVLLVKRSETLGAQALRATPFKVVMQNLDDYGPFSSLRPALGGQNTLKAFVSEI